jgi:putative ABC transport system ATP-binding protein
MPENPSIDCPSAPASPLICASGVGMHYGHNELTTGVLQGLDFSAEAGEFVVILGRSGSGKSTFLNLLGGMDQAQTGRIRVGDAELTTMNEEARARFRRRAIGFVFQSFNLLPTLTVAENLALPLALNACHDAQRVTDMLRQLGLDDRGQRFPDQLSGGEQQRVAIGRALIHRPALVLADEPTGNLDADTSRQVLALFHALVRDSGTTLVMATHSPEPQQLADRVLYLDRGQLRERP